MSPPDQAKERRHKRLQSTFLEAARNLYRAAPNLILPTISQIMFPVRDEDPLEDDLDIQPGSDSGMPQGKTSDDDTVKSGGTFGYKVAKVEPDLKPGNTGAKQGLKRGPSVELSGDAKKISTHVESLRNPILEKYCRRWSASRHAAGK